MKKENFKLFNYFKLMLVVAILFILTGCPSKVTTLVFKAEKDNYRLNIGEIAQINMELSDDLSLNNVVYVSSNPEVATVTNGTINCISPGSTTITITYPGESSCSIECNVEVGFASQTEKKNYEKAKEFDDRVNAIKEIDLSLETTINNLSEEYSNMETGVKKFVKSVDTIAELTYKLEALKIDTLIEALPSELSHSDLAKVQEARNAYKQASNSVRAYVTKLQELVEKEEIMENVEAVYAIDLKQAKAFDALVKELPLKVDLSHEKQISKLYKQYDALNTQTKKLVTTYGDLNARLTIINNIYNNINSLKEAADAYVKSLENLPDIVLGSNKQQILAAVQTYLNLDENVRQYIAEEDLYSLWQKTHEVSSLDKKVYYAGISLVEEIKRLKELTPVQITKDYNLPKSLIDEITTKWEYAENEDTSVFDLSSNKILKQMVNTTERKLILTIENNGLTISTDVTINFGMIQKGNQGQFYSDAHSLSDDENGTAQHVGFSGYSIKHTVYTYFFVKNNVYEVESFEEFQSKIASGIANSNKTLAIYNSGSEDIVITTNLAKTSDGVKFFGSTYVIIDNNKVVASGFVTQEITLQPGQFLYTTKSEDALIPSFAFLANLQKVGNDVILTNWYKDYLPENEVEIKNNYILVNKNWNNTDPCIYQNIIYNFGESAFNNIQDAIDKSNPGQIILVLPGVYSENIVINKSINLLTLNSNMPAAVSKWQRHEEANITSEITVNADNVFIKGFSFENADKITATCNNFSFINNLITYTNETPQEYFLNISGNNHLFSGNLFTSHNNVLKGNNVANLVIKNNKMYVKYDAITITNLTGQNYITDNVLKCLDKAISINNFEVEELFISRNNISANNTITLTNGKASSDIVNNINILYNTINATKQGVNIEIADSNKVNANIKHNIFTTKTSFEEFYISSNGLKTIVNDNYFNGDANCMAKIIGNVEVADICEKITFVEPVKSLDVINAVSFTVPETINIYLYEDTKLDYGFIPIRANTGDITFTSSNTEMLKINDKGIMTAIMKGSVTVEAKLNSTNETKTFTVTIDEPARVELRYSENSYLFVGENTTINAEVKGKSATLVWSSSNESVATVSQTGVVTANKVGTALITAKCINGDEKMTVGISVFAESDRDNKAIMKVLEANESVTFVKNNITVTGYQFIYRSNIYSSVSRLLLTNNPISELETPKSNSNRPGEIKKSTEYITVHDTASSADTADALAHATYVKSGGGGTSWHYSSGDDAIYHQIPDNETAYHAGDGSRYYELIKTNVRDDHAFKVNITIDNLGFYAINGVSSNVAAPKNGNRILKTSDINDAGVHWVIGTDGYYYLGNTYFNTDYNKISNYGGNKNSIGIESMVNLGSDLYLTWQRLANLVSLLLVQNNLDVSRVKPHHFFSGKNCPQTMRDNNLWLNFLDLVAYEYDFRTTCEGYTLQGESYSLPYVYNNGRVHTQPIYSTSVLYSVTITKGLESRTIELYSIIPGVYN